jgi:hypothetical protein
MRKNKATNLVWVIVTFSLTLFSLPYIILSIPFSFICGFFINKVLEDINEDIGVKK